MEANKLGAFRRYTHALSWLPKNEQRLDLACDSSDEQHVLTSGEVTGLS